MALYYGSLTVASATILSLGSVVLAAGTGSAWIGHLTAPGGTISGSVSGGVQIGIADCLSGAFTTNGSVFIGGPVARWASADSWGNVVDKTTGRGGSATAGGSRLGPTALHHWSSCSRRWWTPERRSRSDSMGTTPGASRP